MANRIKKLIILFIIIFCFPLNGLSGEAEQIKGISDFLISRANDNLSYILQQKLKANILLQKYLPVTYNYAASNNLILLLQNSAVLKKTIEKDLKKSGLFLLVKLNKDCISDLLEELIDEDDYKKVLKDAYIKVDGKDISIADLKDKSDSYKLYYGDFFDAQNSLKKMIKELSEDKITPENIDDKIIELKSAFDKIKNQMESLNKTENVTWKRGINFKKVFEKISKNLDEPFYSAFCWDINKCGENPNSSECKEYREACEKEKKDENKLEIFESKNDNGSGYFNNFYTFFVFLERAAFYKEQLKFIKSSNKEIVDKLVSLDMLIRLSIKNDENPFIEESDMETYSEFSRLIIGIASIIHSESSEAVKIVLNQLTMDPVSFGIKREPGADKLMITAYFGGQAGQESTSIDGDQDFYGLFIPVGLEYSHGFTYGSFSIMISPLDFAHPVNQRLNKSEVDMKYEDIFNPGLYLSLGCKKLPIIVGFGLSYGRSLSYRDNDENEGRVFGFIAMDMPLFSFN